jgi:hypothetical protein
MLRREAVQENLAYLGSAGQALEPARPRVYFRCANSDNAAGCNWLVPAPEPANLDPTAQLCASCVLNRTIPDLSQPGNPQAWNKIEVAKRRLVSMLIGLGLPVYPRTGEHQSDGLAFDFLQDLNPASKVTTGHENGVITLNIAEADDATRERIRTQRHEPYRTLIGHLRHEAGHHYWDQLVAGTHWLEPFRELFGDDRAGYGESLATHYQQGPPPNWQQSFVTAYATSHPWEDWAETWAHYLHMLDAHHSAQSFGVDLGQVRGAFESFSTDALYRADSASAAEFLHLINAWTPLTAVLNELTRSMGLADFYPFVLSRAAVQKLHFIHLVVSEAGKSI